MKDVYKSCGTLDIKLKYHHEEKITPLTPSTQNYSSQQPTENTELEVNISINVESNQMFITLYFVEYNLFNFGYV